MAHGARAGVDGLLRGPGPYIALVAGLGASALSRLVDAGWIPALGLGALLGVGVLLWAADPAKSWGDLGQGIMVSVIVAIGLLAVQNDLDDRVRHQDEARARASERQSFRLALGQQRDLRGIDLRNRNLRGFFLARKNLAGANLELANVTKTYLREAELREVSAVGARFDGSDLTCASLVDGVFGDAEERGRSSASFREAELSYADLRGAYLLRADFRGATLFAADLRDATLGAKLAGAELRAAALAGADLSAATGLQRAEIDGDTSYSQETEWPPGFDVRATEAYRVTGADGPPRFC